ncbi:hypothetical protein DP113_25100 [Brasilonema octagenarum UFV-E1]|uniref:Uncharacterized protein n=1 Tax=Brasilonema sennae CENA114 TaxID=415709 RepID=A0A856MKA2_9CYAN|nr:hypothetical protein [Brasilonema sennae]QDL10759.1 hypothetical protein DP114_25195 [Brasilonema sennae CENA114]QDL17104.1 hypothetical protein DP113_25100 [Brasilonema octagenarum UFV-E1]
MSVNLVQDNGSNTNQNHHSIQIDVAFFILRLKNGIWFFGIPSFLFGISDRSITALADGYLSVVEIIQIFTASFFFLSWLFLKPEQSFDLNDVDSVQNYLEQFYLRPTRVNNFDLRKRHIISQEYILPFPYVCQIYHLLNLKHLETIHKFSLNNLRILKVSNIQSTSLGGIITFQTLLESPVNLLRIWRQPIVEVDLILHTPYTVELSIPVYRNKRITVMFYAYPSTENAHHFLIDIYSDLEWPKPILQIILHIASCLTLIEDLPYLQKLAQRNIGSLINKHRQSNHETMWLFNRFAELHGSSVEMPKLKNSEYSLDN